jgi:Holliday junction resolvase RusA-like endonuclease
MATTPRVACEVRLPLPPSTNHLFINLPQGRAKSREYQAWLAEAGRMPGWVRLREARDAPLCWRAKVDAFGLDRRRDLDNICKATLDLVCLMSGLSDNWCDEVWLRRHTTRGERGVLVLVTVWEA